MIKAMSKFKIDFTLYRRKYSRKTEIELVFSEYTGYAIYGAFALGIHFPSAPELKKALDLVTILDQTVGQICAAMDEGRECSIDNIELSEADLGILRLSRQLCASAAA
jgi:hypothetical protein